MKKVLIISPHFVPVNAADMHRVRHSLSYYNQLGWDAEVIAVDPSCIESYSTDLLLAETIPDSIRIHHVKAWNVKQTRKFGLGSLSIRSFWHYLNKGNELLSKDKYDLIFFSTTAFHVIALGRYWKKKFNIPFVVDMQDPWRNDYYLDRPKSERPSKFRIAYNLDKYLENYAMKAVDGLISVSQGYIDILQHRYSNLEKINFSIIPFGYSLADFEIAQKHAGTLSKIKLPDNKVNIVYVGRGGHDLKPSIECFFLGLKKYFENNAGSTDKIHCWFIGTSYAPGGKGIKTIEPIAKEIGVEKNITEITDRLTFFETIHMLIGADGLFVPGSRDRSYTASKIYQYVLAQKPTLAIFHKKSGVVRLLDRIGYGKVLVFDDNFSYTQNMIDESANYIKQVVGGEKTAPFNAELFDENSAYQMTRKQVELFNVVVDSYNSGQR